MDEISQKKISLYTMSLVNWVSGGGLGKIRFNCHGDGEGYLEMVSKGVAHSIPANCLGDWLGANGLTEKRNLKAISLNLCMAAKHFLTPAVLQNGQYSPAEGSAVDLLAKTLGSRGVTGVEVTGSNENVTMIDENRFLKLNPEDEIKLRMGLSIEDQKLRVGDNVRMIGVPIGFKFDVGSRTLTIPDGWTIEAKPMSGSQLFAVKCPADSTVERAASKIVRTHQLATGDFTFKSPGRKDVSFPSQGWILAGKQMISAEGWTAAGTTQIRFSGTGGVIQVEGQSGEDGSGVIYERLAKSKAKAVATS
ncbi:MAG: hypothetical protein WA324_08195 [Bryobacteraceae bacterium]